LSETNVIVVGEKIFRPPNSAPGFRHWMSCSPYWAGACVNEEFT